MALLAEAMEPFRGAVVGQLQVHTVRGALGGHHALQHVEGRLVCLVGEARGQRALHAGRFVRRTASGSSLSSVANSLPRSVVTTKFPSSPVHDGLPGEDVHHHQAVLRSPPCSG